ncbi:MAG: hypothetical protein NTW21_34545 [Verrucomicrobia bacterium]|nr:hypothetical protein [Verrucomicrobiota bacterium]
MTRWRKPLMVLVALLVAGALRMPIEVALTGELRAAGLLPAPLAISTRDKIGQTSSAVALGGLRTLVATFLDLRAFTFFTECRWDDVADTFDTMVDLAPHTAYYWETGAWHQAFNAASYYLNDSGLPPLRRTAAWRASVLRGREFLERGIRNNPGAPKLNAYLGFLLTDRNKFRAFRDDDATFSAAADAYRIAADSGAVLPYVRRFQLYALARVPSRNAEALALARTLYQSPSNRTPTMQCVCFALEVHANPSPIDPKTFAVSIFGSAENAYGSLSNYWLRARERLPVHGVASALKALEAQLGIPEHRSIFLKQPVQDTEDE